MISEYTRDLLRAAANRNNFGGRVYEPKLYSDEEIIIMVKNYISANVEHLSLFDLTKVHKNAVAWKNDIGQRVLESCRHKIYYYLDFYRNDVKKCPHCDATRTISCYTSRGTLKTKYCDHCTANKVWAKGKFPERGMKISKSKKEWYKTEEGKQFANNIGKINSQKMQEFNQTSAGKYNIEKSREVNRQRMRSKILSGEFTPNSNNRNTHWDTFFNGKRYRSSWEALYQYFNPDAEYEILRLTYQLNGIEKIYIVDFVDHKNKKVIEVKPIELCKGKAYNAKMVALLEWASKHEYEIVLVDLIWLQQQGKPTTLELFDQHTVRKIEKIYAKIKN